MRLKALVLKNFRGYQGEVRISFEPGLTTFIGRNDVGKSSILDALAVFFDSPLVKPEADDLCVHANEKEMRIGCVFDDLPATLVLDATSTTSLQEEHLLNKDGDLELHKVFDCSVKSPKARVIARALHPSAPGYGDLLQLKNSELKARVREKGVDTTGIDQRSNPLIRKTLWASCSNLDLEMTEIELNKEDAKRVWEQIQVHLPIFSVFRADRPSTDEDSEVQDPMKMAVRQAISELTRELQDIQEKVRNAALDVARRTLIKLNELDPGLAKDLSPAFRTEPKWDAIFKLALMTDEQIPANKRGSGVRRLILLGFFRAEAEKKRKDEGKTNVIYAIEEPETSQHPSNQKLILNALLELASAEGCQVIITTHVPGLAEMVPLEGLRYVCHDGNGRRVIEAGSEEVFRKVADELGVIPDNRVRVLVCVEGPNDVLFLKNLARILKEAGEDYSFDLDSPEVVFLPLGGSTLRDWVSAHYLRPLNRPEIHIYDRGKDVPPKYQTQCDMVNGRDDRSRAFLTLKSEAENYLHPEAIRQVLGVEVAVTDENDVPLAVARLLHEADENAAPWEQLSDDRIKKKENRAKQRLNTEVAAAMTLEMLQERNALDEVSEWFGAIKAHLT